MTFLHRMLLVVLLCTAVGTLCPTDAAAQRHGRVVRTSRVVVAAPAYYGFYDPFFWGYSGWYPYGQYAPPYGPAVPARAGSARIQVTPRDAEVYVDGYLAGSVDDFDGFLQRLDVAPGEHELTFYRDGYRTFRQTVLFRPRVTLKISYAMEALPQGAPSEPRPQAGSGAERSSPEEPRAASPVRQPEAPRDFGTLAVRVQPRDAELFIDGEQWTAPEGDGPILIELADGSHEIEVRKQGLKTYRTTVRVRGGETLPLNVSLSR